MAQKTIPIEFPNAQGDVLAARLELPDGPPDAHALFAHCFTCSKDIAAAGRISRALRARGIAVLRFDFTGLGGSEGDFANTNFSSNVQDLVAAADYLRTHHAAPQLLVGHSLGGAAVLAGARHVPETRAVATIAAPSDPAHVRRLLAGDAGRIEREGVADVALGGRTFTIKKQFLDDLEGHDLGAGLDAALLVFHSPADELVELAHAQRLFDAAPQPKNFIALDGADHLLTNPADSEYVAETLATWAGRYLGRSARAAEAPLEPGTATVVETGDGTFTQRIRVGRHTLIADEPRDVGGDDRGPTPYDYLLAGLGACTSMTLRMYARHKKLPVESIAVSMRHSKIHAQDCADCETTEGKVDLIQRHVAIAGDLDDAQRARMLEIAERCPVHRTLHGEVKITTEAAPE